MPLLAQPETPNHTHNNYYLYNQNNFSVSVLYSPQSDHEPDDHQMKTTSRQAIYAFTVTALLNLVQIKYQPLADSPFETHPKTMFLVVAGLILYCWLSYQVHLTRNPLSSPTNQNRMAACFKYFGGIILRFCGPLSLASIISLLLPESLCSLVFSLSLLFSLYRILPSSYVEPIWEMVRKVATYIMQKFRGQPQYSNALKTRRGGGIHVQLPDWLPQQTNNTAVFNQFEILPL